MNIVIVALMVGLFAVPCIAALMPTRSLRVTTPKTYVSRLKDGDKWPMNMAEWVIALIASSAVTLIALLFMADLIFTVLAGLEYLSGVL